MPLKPHPFVIGRRFGRWTALEERRLHSSGRNRRAWLCRCDCGAEQDNDPSALIQGQSTQCRTCSNREKAALKSRLTHGGTETRLYSIWSMMRRRCNSPTCDDYPRYGGRGIAICAEWSDFAVFRAWALSNGYQPALTIDRRDNERGYEPGNCHWTTRTAQNRNRRDNVRYPFRGKRLTIPEIAEIVRLPAPALRLRVIRYGMSIEEATTRPLRRRRA